MTSTDSTSGSRVTLSGWRHRVLICGLLVLPPLLLLGAVDDSDDLSGMVIAVVAVVVAWLSAGLVSWAYDIRFPDAPWSAIAYRFVTVAMLTLVVSFMIGSLLLSRADTSEPGPGPLVAAAVIALIALTIAVGYRWLAGRSAAPPRFAWAHVVVAATIAPGAALLLLLLSFLIAFCSGAAALLLLIVGLALIGGALVAAMTFDRRYEACGFAVAIGRMTLVTTAALVGLFALLVLADEVGGASSCESTIGQPPDAAESPSAPAVASSNGSSSQPSGSATT